ncbi:uncharacterized protein LOC128683813 [Plodia interpunctella]|uniref:uncharacterized protein LOC128683813 n=1 Tax=Plodia interpunctella TaxID=58824 RepID=UPI002367440A|nr:uncharacterized protein LOC128683813 [Plodia interpunctella]
MEWSKDKTLKLIELLQVNATLWNPSLCDSRKDKQKRKEELRAISELLGIPMPDITKKIQHLRTQYNRESAREARAFVEDPNDRYISNWYAFEYLHFMKDSNKPYRIIQSELQQEVNGSVTSPSDNSTADWKIVNMSPPHKVARTDSGSMRPEVYPSVSQSVSRDEFSVFGEYVANELRSLKGEKNLLVAKKKIQDVIFDVKMGLICETKTEQNTPCSVFNQSSQPHTTSNLSGKLYTAPVMSTTTHLDPACNSQGAPSSGISEIIINSACHYSNFKVDSQ